MEATENQGLLHVQAGLAVKALTDRRKLLVQEVSERCKRIKRIAHSIETGFLKSGPPLLDTSPSLSPEDRQLLANPLGGL